ncbi:MAG TPA: A/G-specific adenine glycosylase [Chloroflexota bacterium]|jgi:A/G-specific adenine glycosylase
MVRAAIEAGALEYFQRELLSWYEAEGRDLPWRRTEDPYAILVSEIMLQQTQVRTVLPYYERFLERFPSLAALAAAPLDEVKEITDPLGYKVRGERLKRIAETAVERYGGSLPDSEQELLALPGIGRYTAGAVRSFAFRQDAPILDTNVLRLLVRLFDPPHEGGGAALLRRLWALAEAVIPPGQGYVFNQALMDFGAQVCTARRPICLFCPLRPICGRWNPHADVVSYEE